MNQIETRYSEMINMAQVNESPSEVADSFARSQIYHLLAIGFRHPTLEWFKLYQSGYFIVEILKLLSAMPRLSGIALEEAATADKIYMDMEGAGYQDFETKYVNTFNLGSPKPPCPIIYSSYVTEAIISNVLQEVTAFYMQYGLVMNHKDGKDESPDHLCFELEFLHFLTLKEYQARKDNQSQLLNGYVHAQKDFLERHLIGWYPKFYEQVQQVDQLPFYKDLSRITLRFTHCEYEFVSALTSLGQRPEQKDD